MWTIRQNYTGQIVYVPDEGIAKEIIDSIDIAYLLHYSYLLIPKPFGKFKRQDLRYMSKAIRSGNVDRLFPTRITAVIGNDLLIRFMIDSAGYRDILQHNGIEEERFFRSTAVLLLWRVPEKCNANHRTDEGIDESALSNRI